MTWRKRTIMEMARECGIPEFENNESQADNIIRFAELVREEAIAETNARANASWTLMCAKMVSIEREAIIDLVAFYGGPVDLEAAIRARGDKHD